MYRTSLFSLLGAPLCALLLATSASAAVVSFGSGINQFNMDFVPIGNPGNAADTTGNPNPVGAVGYTYDLGKFEVSEDMITKYNAVFGTANGLTITQDARGTNKPATSVSWNEAARFTNWLNTSSGGFAAYKFTTSGVNDNIALWTAAETLDYDAANPFRSLRANYVLPNFNEWYKAAYYDPSANGGLGGYWNFATGSDTAPMAVASGTTAGTAVYSQSLATGPADVFNAGGLSPFGVMGLGGNVWEWQETENDLVNDSISSNRGVRGGVWNNNSDRLSSSIRSNVSPSNIAFNDIGFRVASLTPIPEPSTYALVLTGLTVLGWTGWRRRGK